MNNMNFNLFQYCKTDSYVCTVHLFNSRTLHPGTGLKNLHPGIYNIFDVFASSVSIHSISPEVSIKGLQCRLYTLSTVIHNPYSRYTKEIPKCKMFISRYTGIHMQSPVVKILYREMLIWQCCLWNFSRSLHWIRHPRKCRFSTTLVTKIMYLSTLKWRFERLI